MRYSEINHQHFPFKDSGYAYSMAIDLLPKHLEKALIAGDEISCIVLLEVGGEVDKVDEITVQERLAQEVPNFAEAEILTQIIASRIMKSGIDGPILYKCEFPEIKLSS